MHPLRSFLVVALAVGAATPVATAEMAPSPPAAATATPTASATAAAPTPPPVSPTVVPERPMTFEEKVLAARAAAAEAAKLPPVPRLERSSGFWIGGRKATGGAYYYPLMLAGLGALLLSAFFTVRGLRRINRQRRAAAPPP